MSEYIQSFGAGLAIPGIRIAVPSGQTDVGAMTPVEEESQETIDQPSYPQEPVAPEAEGMLTIEELATTIYDQIYAACMAHLKTWQGIATLVPLTMKMLYVDGVLHIESFRETVTQMLYDALYGEIGLLPKTNVPVLASNINDAFHAEYPDFPISVASKVASILYEAQSGIYVDPGVGGELPLDEPIEDEGTVTHGDEGWWPEPGYEDQWDTGPGDDEFLKDLEQKEAEMLAQMEADKKKQQMLLIAGAAGLGLLLLLKK